ncbi:LacI family DNA-binding transcriptional regulator [Leucothrix pacifica]|uniref:LacI family transcriptional regulator n=1 Tax=Leucothrix pacifica TaxID=1247513 RepID=A0A317C4Z5_9GAMM|nr:LacI family DNA-binding transcriptional regulator [Leucothrix pacifica]PWQ93349.1 LacI family transcriptional regulator [Leucothrix pacifica]
MTKSSVTSTDVAKLANVSQSAVSRTFTPGASVSGKTRERVLAAAKELGYRPNVLARSLISGRSRIIGLVIAYLENHFYPIVIEKLSRSLQARGYHVLLFMTEPGQQDEVIQEILQYQVDGVVLASVTLSSHIAQECAGLGVPVVLFNRYVPDTQASSVVSDNVSGGRMLAELLIKEGHNNIAFIAGQENSSTNVEREQGFNEALAAAGLQVSQRAVGYYTFEGATIAAREILDQAVPDAIFVANDHMAFAVMDVIRGEYGLRIPEDISVVGYDDVPEAGWPSYNLTTVEQPVEKMIADTVEILLEQMEHKQVSPTRRVTEAGLMLRGSTKSSLA